MFESVRKPWSRRIKHCIFKVRMMEVGLVSCTKSKKDSPSKPKELYMESSLFRKMRNYCESNHDDWYIISAKHNLLNPDGEPIEPYNETLKGKSRRQKRKWSRKTFEHLKNRNLLSHTLVIHAIHKKEP